MGSMAMPYGLPKTGPPVSVCHMWSMTGMRSPSTRRWNHSQAGGLRTSPAHTTRLSDVRSKPSATFSP